jgi:hypothetical protein
VLPCETSSLIAAASREIDSILSITRCRSARITSSLNVSRLILVTLSVYIAADRAPDVAIRSVDALRRRAILS